MGASTMGQASIMPAIPGAIGGSSATIITLVAMIYGTTAFQSPPLVQPQNVWVMLANATGHDAICLSTSSPENPFHMCLVEIPLGVAEWPTTGSPPCDNYTTHNTVDNWDGCVVHWSLFQGLEPQEIELLGSLTADYCFYFNYIGKNQSYVQIVNALLAIYQNESIWCNYTSKNISRSSNTPVTLLKGVFLVCGD